MDFMHYFLPTTMSDSEMASSILTDRTFTSTIPGLGATSGKAVKLVGSVVVNGVEAILIRRRISKLETIFKLREEVYCKANYEDLLELSRSVYEPSIRKRAFRVIMGIVGGMEFEDLASAVSEWHLSESYDLLKEMALCFRLENGPEEYVNILSSQISTNLRCYGMRRLPSSYIQRHDADTSMEVPLCNAFLLFIALVISFSENSSFSKLVIHELDMLTFITQTFPAILYPNSEFNSTTKAPLLLPAKLVFRALLEKLDPTADSLDAPSIAQLEVLLSTTVLNSISLVSENDLRVSILSPWTRVRLGVNIPSSSSKEYVHNLNTVSQRYRYTREFRDSHHGTRQFGYWLSIAYINNQEYGRATARTRTLAREYAARQALALLGHCILYSRTELWQQIIAFPFLLLCSTTTRLACRRNTYR
ncbi:hypothetical protein BT96DRAFT_1019433 [Gymnopus androsaceus JB14]|uniref:DRBM domain-containing protein n=1 Tax=Gymnopus androsaceus JB14 TaxID=1447944 RepID=A0A6A4HM47_9AGAR|nr:hypothetical protein BT96DRAFT_1019433 [Gymnopus androsaceus JB14]